jgi:hypothetical protein
LDEPAASVAKDEIAGFVNRVFETAAERELERRSPCRKLAE